MCPNAKLHMSASSCLGQGPWKSRGRSAPGCPALLPVPGINEEEEGGGGVAGGGGLGRNPLLLWARLRAPGVCRNRETGSWGGGGGTVGMGRGDGCEPRASGGATGTTWGQRNRAVFKKSFWALFGRKGPRNRPATGPRGERPARAIGAKHGADGHAFCLPHSAAGQGEGVPGAHRASAGNGTTARYPSISQAKRDVALHCQVQGCHGPRAGAGLLRAHGVHLIWHDRTICSMIGDAIARPTGVL